MTKIFDIRLEMVQTYVLQYNWLYYNVSKCAFYGTLNGLFSPG